MIKDRSMKKTIFKISRMDCSSEEQLIRMKLESFSNIKHLEFDIPSRQLGIYHIGDIDQIHQAISELNLNDKLENTEDADLPSVVDESHQRKILWWVSASL